MLNVYEDVKIVKIVGFSLPTLPVGGFVFLNAGYPPGEVLMGVRNICEIFGSMKIIPKHLWGYEVLIN